MGPPQIKHFTARAVVFREGQERDVAYLLRKGSVEISRMIDNEKVVLAILSPGEVFGEFALLNEEGRSATARAMSSCEVLVIDKQQLDDLLAQCPAPVVSWVRQISRRLERQDALLTGLGSQGRFSIMVVLVSLLARAHSGKPFEFRELQRLAGQSASIPALDMEEALDRLKSLKLVAESTGGGRQARMIQLPLGSEEFLDRALRLDRELRLSGPRVQPLTLSLEEFAEKADTTLDVVLRRLSQGLIPPEILSVNRCKAERWLEEGGAAEFKRKHRRKKVGELEDVDDIVHVDKATMEEVLAKLGYHKSGVLYALAGPRAREKLLACVSRKAADILKAQDPAPADVDAATAEDVQHDLIEAILTAKRLAKPENTAGDVGSSKAHESPPFPPPEPDKADGDSLSLDDQPAEANDPSRIRRVEKKPLEKDADQKNKSPNILD